MKDNIKELAEQIARLDTSELYDLATVLVENHKVESCILQADLELVS